jgi:DNA repair protein RecO (recombination protein O)
MYQKTDAIVLGAVKYGENGRVLKCYTEQFGLQSYMVNSISSKKGVIKSAMILPLTQLTIVASHKDKGTLERIKECTVAHPYTGIYVDPVRNALALFLAEVLMRSLKEEQGNVEKYAFVTDSCNLLDELPEVPAHFHISFLLGLSRYLGFYPETASANNGVYFDLMEGVFLPTSPLHPYQLGVESTAALKELCAAGFNTPVNRISKHLRKELLAGVLQYYKLHVDGFGDLKSVEVLEELFL